MTVHKRWIAVGACSAALTLAACGDDGGGGDDGGDYPSGSITFTAPTDPGSGFDLTLRTVAKVLQEQGLVDATMTVQNRPGGLTNTWEQSMIDQHTGEDDQISIQSLGTQLIDVEGKSDNKIEDFTPLASLLQEFFLVVTSPDAPFDDLDGAFAAMQENPSEFPIASQLEDTLALVLLAKEAGVDPSELTFVTYEGGAEQATAVLNGDVTLAIAGVSEFQPLVKGGELKGLAVVSEERFEGLDVATSAEQGYETDLSNWRMLYGPPDMPVYAVEYWTDAVQKMTESDAWHEVATENHWVTSFRSGEELTQFLDESEANLSEALESYGQEIIPEG